jgi:hypothetical protein
MSRAGGGVTRAPLGGAAEVAMRYESFVFLFLLDLDFLALDEVAILPGTYARPRHAEVREFAHGNGRFLGEYLRDFLVRAPIGTANGIEVMECLVVAFRLDTIAE